LASENRPRIITVTKHSVVVIGLFTADAYNDILFLILKDYDNREGLI